MMGWIKRILMVLALLGSLSASWAQNMDQWFIAGNEAYEKKQFKTAIQHYRNSIRNGQRETFSWFNMGNALVQLKRYGLAAVAYKRALEIHPGFTRAWVLLGDLHFVDQAWENALTAYNRALENGEKTIHVYGAMAEAAYKLGAYTDAQYYFDQLLKLEPHNLSAWLALAEIGEKVGDLEMAEKMLDEALKQSPASGADIYFYQAGLFSRQENNAKTIRALENGLMLKPNASSYRRWLAQLYQASEKPWMGVFILEEGTRYDAKNSELWLDLANVQFQLKNYEEALTSYLSAQKLGESRARIGIENVGNIFYNLGDTTEAARIYDLTN